MMNPKMGFKSKRPNNIQVQDIDFPTLSNHFKSKISKGDDDDGIHVSKFKQKRR